MKDGREVSKNFGLTLKHLRLNQNLTLAELSEITGISSSYLNRLELGSRKAPSVPITRKIAKAINIPITTLLDISENRDDEDAIPTLTKLLLCNDFTIDENVIEGSAKEAFIELTEYVTEVNSFEEDKLKYLVEVADLIDKFKERMRAS